MTKEDRLGMKEVKQKVDGKHPTLRQFCGKSAIILLTFLSTLRDAFEMIGGSEGEAVRVLTYLLEGEARDVLMEKMEEGEEEV